MTKRYRVTVLMSLVLLLVAPHGLRATNGVPLGLGVKKFSVRQANIIRALRLLRTIVGKDSLLFGLEVAPFETEPERNLTISLTETTVGKVLDEIIRQDPRYTYEVIDEHLIHVFPRNSKDDPANLLNIPVEHFSVSGVGYDELIQYLPFRVPELQAEIMRRSRAGGIIRKYSSGDGYSGSRT